MLDPDYLQQVAEGAESIAEELHEYLIRKIVDGIMARLGRGEEYILSSSDTWRIKVMQDAGILLDDITAEIAKYTNRQKSEVKAAMEEAGVKAISYDNAIYEAAGLNPAGLTESPALIRLMERNYNATMGTWNNLARTTANAAQTLFINQCDLAYSKVASGAAAYNTAVREALEEIAEGGVTVKYPSGYKMSIEAATAMIVRTGIAQAAAEIQIARMKEMGYSLVITSSHMGARPTHQVWQGGIYHVDWDKISKARSYL